MHAVALKTHLITHTRKKQMQQCENAPSRKKTSDNKHEKNKFKMKSWIEVLQKIVNLLSMDLTDLKI